MQCKVKSNPQQREFIITGDFTVADEERFFDVFLHIRRQTESQIVFDLSGCALIDVSAMGMLVVACQEAAKRNIIRVIRGASAEMRDQLKSHGFENFYFFQ